MAAAPRVSIDLGSTTPAYRQIASDLRRHLVEQRLKPGDLLPPIRQLALDLGVHFNTVALAYRMLADEGWLELKRRRGAVVMARSAPRSMDRTRVDQLLQQLGHIAAELRSAGMSARQISAALQRVAQGVRP
jgi:GntR family transcriptional regulator